jgi:hypothetical protein
MKKRTITIARAREIATDWHGGQWSALYQFASSGVYVVANHLLYLRESQENREPEYYLVPGTISQKNDKELQSLINFFNKLGLAQSEPLMVDWVKHSIYGYLMPVCDDKRLNQPKYLN